MYAMSTASTTTSGSRADLTAATVERRVRVVRLLRPRKAAPAFGFSLRGGREYATGFFISKVELNSEAHLQGLKVGDQVISVNGYRVDDAVHAELVHYITSQSRLKIKVRHVGMIPVKDKEQESLSWQFVSERASLASDVSSSPTLCHNTEQLTDLRLSILVPPRAKLGCGICKGPDWKPGIFVQFVREGGIAREAGLRPGDQILSCNGHDFANISFNEAISAMKASGRLELVVREGTGAELVSPESSGYNSSASSAAGERSPAAVPGIPLAPPAALRRRLASVAEEAADRADRLTINRIKRRTWDSLDFDWKNKDIHNFDAPSDIEPDYDSPSIPNNPHTYESKSHIKSKTITEYESTKVTSPLNRTIINLTEDGATIQCSYDNNTSRKNMFPTSQLSRDKEKKTIVVEVHHMNTTSCAKTHCNYPPPFVKEIDADSTSISSSATLSSAIAEEIQRRKLNKKPAPEKETNPIPIKKTNIPKAIDNDQKKHHDALMDEFKKVHRKMFANLDTVNGDINKENKADHLVSRPRARCPEPPRGTWRRKRSPMSIGGYRWRGRGVLIPRRAKSPYGGTMSPHHLHTVEGSAGDDPGWSSDHRGASADIDGVNGAAARSPNLPIRASIVSENLCEDFISRKEAAERAREDSLLSDPIRRRRVGRRRRAHMRLMPP
ncbi:unnamed protein product [Euphydryas editha]|uniref:PDZ domain-containing protein n=1 Tax=Euphydryas editha TaxID=104508 RepID=A0AAU9U1F8_EUPED|nr:unnamed protein product [Euphydryas editha]